MNDMIFIFKEYPEIVNVKQLSKMLDISYVLASKLVSSGEIFSKRIGREYKIPKFEVVKYLYSADAANEEQM